MTKLEESYTKAKDFIVDESLQVRVLTIAEHCSACFVLPFARARIIVRIFFMY